MTTSFSCTPIKGVLIFHTNPLKDDRGVFSEIYKDNPNFPKWVQENQSVSYSAGTVRGLHFQRGDYAQTKLVRCAGGSILDVAVDLRPDSPTYGSHVSAVLSQKNGNQLLVPKGFAHGFMTLTDDAVVVYKVDAPYNKESEGSLFWNDPELKIEWRRTEATQISEKDALAPLLKDVVL